MPVMRRVQMSTPPSAATHPRAIPLPPPGPPNTPPLAPPPPPPPHDGVAAPAGKDQSELAAIVAQARADGIPLSVVVVQGNPWHDSSLRDLATEVGKFQHGTVAVFSDDWMGTYSDSISRVHLEWAEDAAKWKGGKSEEAVQIFADRLQQPESVPWTGFTSVLLAGTVAAVGGLYWVKRRRAASAAPDSADESVSASA
nr:DUF6676 family protein [Nocardia cyriacigeorgica]